MSFLTVKQIERNLPNFQYDKDAPTNAYYRFVDMIEGENADEICDKVLFQPEARNVVDDDPMVYNDAHYVFLLERLDDKILMYFYADTCPYRRYSKRIRRNRIRQASKKFRHFYKKI